MPAKKISFRPHRQRHPPVTAGRIPLDRFAPAGAGNTRPQRRSFRKRKDPDYTHCRAEYDMPECLQGLRIALLAADGVGQIELEASGEAVRHAGAQTQLLSLRTGHIESLDTDLGPGRTYTVDQTVAQATVDEYEALLLVPGTVKSDRLSSDDLVVSFVRDFITSGKPVGIVCYGAWTLLEAGVARGQSLPLSATMRAQRKTGVSVLRGELISPRELSAFYSTIVDEFARLTRQPAPASAEHAWARVAVLPPRPRCEKYSAAQKVADS
jgi:protease I